MAGINSFIQKIGEGVKPNMFLVQIPFPGGKEDDLTNLLCKSTALPASNLGVIEVPSEEEPLRSLVIVHSTPGLQPSSTRT